MRTMALVHQAHVIARLSGLRAGVAGLIIVNIGSSSVIKPLVAAAEREMRLVELGIMFQRLLESRYRAIKLAARSKGNAQIIVRLSQLRVGLHRFKIFTQRAIP